MKTRDYRLGFALSALVVWCGCESVQESRPVDKHVPATDVGRLEAWMDAEKVASHGDGRTTVMGAGDSMRPIYGEGTVLVLTKIAYEDLKPGMQVAYSGRNGRRVVHVLIERDQKGWRVRGLNNEVEDAARVTPYNLIGVVYASFATDENLK